MPIDPEEYLRQWSEAVMRSVTVRYFGPQDFFRTDDVPAGTSWNVGDYAFYGVHISNNSDYYIEDFYLYLIAGGSAEPIFCDWNGNVIGTLLTFSRSLRPGASMIYTICVHARAEGSFFISAQVLGEIVPFGKNLYAGRIDEAVAGF